MSVRNDSEAAVAQSAHLGHRLIQVGVTLFLAALIVGLVVQKMPLPRLALSTHLLGIMQGTFLAVAGLLWPRLNLGKMFSKVTFVLLVYGCLAAWISNLLGAVWSAGRGMVPIAAGNAQGTSLQEMVIKIGLRSAAVALILALCFLLWGLRLRGEPARAS